jgi:hypothetical protein
MYCSAGLVLTVGVLLYSSCGKMLIHLRPIPGMILQMINHKITGKVYILAEVFKVVVHHLEHQGQVDATEDKGKSDVYKNR